MRVVLTVLVVVAVLVVLFVAAVVATHESDFLKDAPAATPDLGLPDSAIQPEDVAEVRFGLTARGYRMREVDEVLARLAGELVARDKRIAQLEQAVAELAEQPGAVPEPTAVQAVEGEVEKAAWPPTTWPGTTPAVALHPLEDFPEVLPAEHVGGQLPEAQSAEEPSPETDAEWRPFEPWSDHDHDHDHDNDNDNDHDHDGADPPPYAPPDRPAEGVAEPGRATGDADPRV